MKLIEGKTLGEIAGKAVEACKNKPVENLFLTGVFDYSEAESEFINSFEDEAIKWQANKKPSDFIINHGAYINTAQGVSASNSTNIRLNKKTVPSVHAECQVLKIARNRRQCLKEQRRLCCSNS